ncbi:MAG: division/cell wall cluster transcriptional repressor MraZ [Dongiaceae bacterium]
MALFFDTFLNKVDAKGRVSVPATFRAALNGQSFHGILALPSLKYSAIQCAGMDWMEELGRQVNQADFLSDEHDDLTAALFGDTKQLPFDGEGRVVLPSSLAAHAGIDGIAAFVGRGPFFEIWHPTRLEDYKTQARKRALDKGRTLNLSRNDKS